jgi:superfamily II DNA/RNA helicase
MNTPTSSFRALGVPDELAAVLERAGISTPFDIQVAAIPDALAGRDVLARAPTGSGKTLAFGLPLVAQVGRGTSRRPRALILSPTRELAEQIRRELEPLATATGRNVLAVRRRR